MTDLLVLVALHVQLTDDLIAITTFFVVFVAVLYLYENAEHGN